MDMGIKAFLSSRRGFIRSLGIALGGVAAFGQSGSAQQTAAPRARPADSNSSGEFNVRDYGAVCDGVRDDYAAFNTALTTIAALSGGGGTLIIPGPMKIGRNVTVPANVALKFALGGALKPTTGVTIAINGTIEAGPWNIFYVTGTFGTFSFNGNVQQREFVAEWWDVPRGGSIDAVPALDKIINGIPDYSTLTFVQKSSMTFRQSWLIKGRVGLKIRALGYDVEETPGFAIADGAWIVPKSSSFSSLVSMIVLDACGHCTIQGFWIRTNVINAGIEICGFGPRISTNNYILNNRISLQWSPAGAGDWTGIQIASSGEQNNEFMVIRGNQIEGNGRKGRGVYTGGGSNNHGHIIEDNNLLGLAVGITAAWGGYTARHNHFTSNALDIEILHLSYPTRIEDNGSELSRQFLRMGAEGGESTVIIEANRLAGLGDNGVAWIELRDNIGPTTFIGNDFQNYSKNNSRLYSFPWNGAAYPGSAITLIGNNYSNLILQGMPLANFLVRSGNANTPTRLPINIIGEALPGAR